MQLSMRDWRLPALFGAALVFARMSGGRLPWFLLYLSGGLLVLTYFWARHALRRTECMVAVESDRMEVGQSLAVKVRMDNDTFLPLPWVEVDDATPQHLVVTDMPRQATSVPLWGSRLLTFKLTAKRRGHYTVGPIRVTLGDAFGMFQGHREFRSKASVTVYPRVHRLEGLPVPLSQPFGPVRTREKAFEDPSNQAEIREYRAGDNPKHIHWKTSARRGELMLREYELNATTHMMLFPDLSFAAQVQDPARERSTAETAIELTASLAHLGLHRKIDVGLICHGQERFSVASGRGQRTFHEILEVLARVESQGALPIEQVLELEAAHLSARSTIVVITPRLTARLAEVLIRLRSNNQVMLVLLDRESFAPAPPVTEAAADDVAATLDTHSERNALTGLLTMRRVAVYLVSAEDDLRRLADLKLTAAAEGVRAWSPGARP